MTRYRASYRCVDGYTIGVIDPEPNREEDEAADPHTALDLLTEPYVNSSKICRTETKTVPLQWWINDLDYYDLLVALLEDANKLACKSPFRELLLRKPTHDQDHDYDSLAEAGYSLFDWDRFPDKRKPFEWQLEALWTAIVMHKGRSMAALCPGSGKTRIGLLFLYYWLYVVGLEGEVLVICETSKELDWYADWKLWTGKSTRRFCVCSYEYATKHAEAFLEHRYVAVVIDECHKLKNPATQRSAGLIPIIQTIRRTLLLSGTPQINRVSELENQLRAIRPDVFSSRDMFLKRFGSGKTVNGAADERGMELPWELKFVLDKVIYRNENVLTTNAVKHRHLWFTTPTEKQMSDYDTMTAKRHRLNAAIAREHRPVEKAQLERTRNALLLSMNRVAGIWKSTNALPRVREIIDTHPGKRIIFFSYQKKVLTAVRTYVDSLNLGTSEMVTGDTKSKAERKRVIDVLSDADQSKGPRFGFFSRCMGAGVTLCPGVTVSVLLELEFDPASMHQKEDRIWRIGTVQDVHIYWLLCDHSYDAETLEKIQTKAEEAKTVVGNMGPFKFEDTSRPELPARSRGGNSKKAKSSTRKKKETKKPRLETITPNPFVQPPPPAEQQPQPQEAAAEFL